MTTNNLADANPGILLVTLDAAEGEEQELHDWYDFEHIPERASVQGFRTLQRYVCLEGWPRLMALYDLDSLQVLESPAYQAIVGDNYTPWSKRVIGKVRGWMRSEAELVGTSPRQTGAAGAPLRLLMVSYRGVQENDIRPLAEKLQAYQADNSEILQARLFRATNNTDGRLYALIELSVPRSLTDFEWSNLTPSSGSVDIANIYTRYWRSQS